MVLETFACDLFYMHLESNSNLPIKVNGTIQLWLEIICYKLVKEKMNISRGVSQ